MIWRQQSRPHCAGIRTRRPRLRKNRVSTAGYSNRSQKGESAFVSSSLTRCGAAVQTRIELSSFTRNVDCVLLRVRCCLSYRSWNAHTGLQEIGRSGSRMNSRFGGWPSYRSYLTNRQLGDHLASRLRQDLCCSAEKVCYTRLRE